MRIKEETFSKEIKVGLPEFSNITVGHTITVEVKEGEEIDRDEAWDVINRELSFQVGSIEANWIQTRQYSNFFKTVIKTPINKVDNSDTKE